MPNVLSSKAIREIYDFQSLHRTELFNLGTPISSVNLLVEDRSPKLQTTEALSLKECLTKLIKNRENQKHWCTSTDAVDSDDSSP